MDDISNHRELEMRPTKFIIRRYLYVALSSLVLNISSRIRLTFPCCLANDELMHETIRGPFYFSKRNHDFSKSILKLLE